jgi:DNA-binding MarR family transcriptional regulator
MSSQFSAPEPEFEGGSAFGRRFSSAVVLFHAAAAERFGLNATDWKCGDVLSRLGPMNPTQLAEHVGMSTAAVTQVIDRLEQAGFARRERDSHDRRKIVVHPTVNPEVEQEMVAVFGSLSEQVGQVLARYTPEQQAAISDYLQQITLIIEAETRRLRTTTTSSQSGGGASTSRG